jgi:hypothetical protein
MPGKFMAAKLNGIVADMVQEEREVGGEVFGLFLATVVHSRQWCISNLLLSRRPPRTPSGPLIIDLY